MSGRHHAPKRNLRLTRDERADVMAKWLIVSAVLLAIATAVVEISVVLPNVGR